uniref:Uncharacterized protein n=1 Tax=Romanomermis culicivorax TaxID=13658 RepID=A0A915IUL3_ROMCU
MLTRKKMLLFLFLILFPSLSNGQNVLNSDDVDFVIVGFRHGFRNPIKFIPNDTTRQIYGWGWEGAGQLTNYGKLQSYGLGTFLRNRYKNFLDDHFVSDQIKAYSSSSERCQMTLLSVLAGLYEPTSKKTTFKNGLSWQPIPYENNDVLLRVYESTCPTYRKVYQKFVDDNEPEAKQWLTSKANLVQYITRNNGFNGSLLSLSSFADNIVSMLQGNVPLPSWIENSTLPGYSNRQTLIDEILKFVASNPILCSKDEQCAKQWAGNWINETIFILDEKSRGRLPDRKIHLYSTHLEGVMPFMRLMGAGIENMPNTGGFILELRHKIEQKSPPVVRLLYHEPGDAKNPLQHQYRYLTLPNLQKVDNDNKWYKLDDFTNYMKKFAINDWKSYCGWSKC